MIVLRTLLFVLGCVLVLSVLFSAIRTFVVPRGLTDRFTRIVFIAMRQVFSVAWYLRRTHAGREQVLAYFAPITLLALPGIWLFCLLIAYMMIFWGLDGSSWSDAFTNSRLSLLYLGANLQSFQPSTIFAFSETVLSLMLAAILISYLPTMYSAFSQREAAVTGLEALAGSPPTPVKMLTRYYLIQGLDKISENWPAWQSWFQVVEETHTALQPLVFYRSPQRDRSWVTAAGAILDTAAIVASTIDRPRDPAAELCIRSGYLCLQRIAGAFQIPYNPDPAPTDPISVKREEFDEVYDTLAQRGLPLKPDRDRAWRDFAGWRVNYDVVLVALAVVTLAPPAPWSSDRVMRKAWAFRRGLISGRRVARALLEGRPLRDERQ